ncbi:MAG: precorrin-6y C5,15-methyltransferase (decarboxylating) subunit CbiE [Rhizobiaceae bacterium]
MPSNDQSARATTGKWLSVVGIGEDGVAGLGDDAKSLIRNSEAVFGGKRHLALAASLISGEAISWPSPFDTTMAAIRQLRGRPVCVLASGDPFLHGVGATLAKQVDPREMRVVPHASSFSLAAARLGWPLQEVETISLHGRELAHIRPLLHDQRKIIALTSDETGPKALAMNLSEWGFGHSVLHVMEALGGPYEKITRQTSAGFDLPAVNPLNLVAISVVADGPDAEIPLSVGLPDTLFDHDGQITKREIRAMTLSALAPRKGELLWDIGAGAGSVSIEWMLCHPSMRAIAIERDEARAARIQSNAQSLGVPDLQVVTEAAPEALDGLPTPDAIFIGGGGSNPKLMDTVISRLPANGRLVANAVTLEMESMLLQRRAQLGGDLVRLAVSRAAPVGTMNGWRPAMPVTQWIWVKP